MIKRTRTAKNDDLMALITSDATLECAYRWLCKARKESHHNNSVWDVRFHWAQLKPVIQQQLLDGDYHFSPCRACKVDGQSMAVWHAQDALVLKAVAIVLTEWLAPSLSPHCKHVAGNGGTKGCIADISRHVKNYGFVCRSDVNSYYATINHRILLKQLKARIGDVRVLNLIRNMLCVLHNVNGDLKSSTIGVNKGNPLSPLLGAIYLQEMDNALAKFCKPRGLCYYRYMDDWIILCKTRYQLRVAVKLMNACLQAVKQTKHPFKTYIGRIKNEGFDFLGYRITPRPRGNLTLAWKTWANHFSKLRQLYEQGTPIKGIAQYVKRWLSWAIGGVILNMPASLQQGFNSALGREVRGLLGWYGGDKFTAG
ncbi:reverse transcriptase/maturase family protein [Vibrio coralliilyticus]|uniref:reverse transcriptase/maturase family protein n=1 Tax=Vibrio coralliilyticus TaxID=190893 RepID=UPI001E386CBA|nr:reverse transcriptase/maturase family protein [Vibrio coralliilyticus]MCC2522303.1 reverse transcriptase/maturase family protein [Vibrio coralliilyticus]